MDREIVNRAMKPGERIGGIVAIADESCCCGERFIEEQTSDERLADIEDFFDNLESLEGAHNAGDGAENAGFGTGCGEG